MHIVLLGFTADLTKVLCFILNCVQRVVLRSVSVTRLYQSKVMKCHKQMSQYHTAEFNSTSLNQIK